jgi:Mlc titration factor MtfA (ptsG expression regulator)
MHGDVVLVLVALAALGGAWYALVLRPRRREARRAAWRSQGLATEARQAMFEGSPVLRRVPAGLRRRVEGHARVLLEEKRFVTGDDLAWEDRMGLIVAGHAALLLAGNETPSYFPRLESILLVADVFAGRRVTELDGGAVIEEEETRVGESWQAGMIILSWPDVLEDEAHPQDGFHVVLHEFSHQLDDEFALSSGAPRLRDARAAEAFAEALDETLAALRRPRRRSRSAALDEYAATDPVELFAVGSEAFFCRPVRLRREHPRLYAALSSFYGLDPVAWPANSGEDAAASVAPPPDASLPH